jgi:hypothetical protein
MGYRKGLPRRVVSAALRAPYLTAMVGLAPPPPEVGCQAGNGEWAKDDDCVERLSAVVRGGHEQGASLPGKGWKEPRIEARMRFRCLWGRTRIPRQRRPTQPIPTACLMLLTPAVRNPPARARAGPVAAARRAAVADAAAAARAARNAVPGEARVQVRSVQQVVAAS